MRELYIDSVQTHSQSSQKFVLFMDGFFTEDGFEGMLEGRDYMAGDMEISLTAVFVNSPTRCQEQALLMKFHSELYHLLCSHFSTGPGKKTRKNTMGKLKNTMRFFNNYQIICLEVWMVRSCSR